MERGLALISKAEGKFKTFLVIGLIVLSVHGAFGFMMFVWEEAMQTAMFGAFAYSNAKDWHGLSRHIDLMEKTHSQAKFFITYLGWPAFLMYPAYLSYLDVNEGYIESAKAQVNKHLKGGKR